MNLSNQKRIYPAAIKKYLVENLNSNSYGNLEKNLDVILKDIGVGESLKANWKTTSLYFLDKRNISKEDNTCDDFEPHERFDFLISSKQDVSVEDYNIAIEKFEANFMDKYQEPYRKEAFKLFEDNEKQEKRKQNALLGLVSVGLLVCATIMVFYLKYIA